jgi:dienelactone hydrolase
MTRGRGLLAALLIGLCGAPVVFAEERVTFPSFDWTSAVKVQVTGRYYRPSGPGRFPAVVILHGCGGPRSNGPQWGEWLAENGFAALVVDSFAPRGIASVCNRPPGRAGFELVIAMTEDAFSAAHFLAARPEIDPGRLAAMGFSYGGNVVRRLGGEDARSYAMSTAPQFRALLPLYPGGCGFAVRDVRRVVVPMLILHAALDDWTPVPPCRDAVEQAKRRGEPVDIVVYSDAHHGFDQVDRTVEFLPDIVTHVPEERRGVHIGGNRAARDLARRDALAFLRRTLGQPAQ